MSASFGVRSTLGQEGCKRLPAVVSGVLYFHQQLRRLRLDHPRFRISGMIDEVVVHDWIYSPEMALGVWMLMQKHFSSMCCKECVFDVSKVGNIPGALLAAYTDFVGYIIKQHLAEGCTSLRKLQFDVVSACAAVPLLHKPTAWTREGNPNKPTREFLEA